MKKQRIQLAILTIIIATGNTYPIIHSVLASAYALNKALQQHKKTKEEKEIIEKSPFITVEKVINKSDNKSDDKSDAPSDDKDEYYKSRYTTTVNTRVLHSMSEYSFNGPELAYYALILTGANTAKKLYSKMSSATKTPLRTAIKHNATFLGCVGLFKQYENLKNILNWEEKYNSFVGQQRENINDLIGQEKEQIKENEQKE